MTFQPGQIGSPHSWRVQRRIVRLVTKAVFLFPFLILQVYRIDQTAFGVGPPFSSNTICIKPSRTFDGYRALRVGGSGHRVVREYVFSGWYVATIGEGTIGIATVPFAREPIVNERIVAVVIMNTVSGSSFSVSIPQPSRPDSGDCELSFLSDSDLCFTVNHPDRGGSGDSDKETRRLLVVVDLATAQIATEDVGTTHAKYAVSAKSLARTVSLGKLAEVSGSDQQKTPRIQLLSSIYGKYPILETYEDKALYDRFVCFGKGYRSVLEFKVYGDSAFAISERDLGGHHRLLWLLSEASFARNDNPIADVSFPQLFVSPVEHIPFIAGFANGNICVFDVNAGRIVKLYESDRSGLRDGTLVMSPQGTIVAFEMTGTTTNPRSIVAVNMRTMKRTVFVDDLPREELTLCGISDACELVQSNGRSVFRTVDGTTTCVSQIIVRPKESDLEP